jgi:hypothetical protein
MKNTLYQENELEKAFSFFTNLKTKKEYKDLKLPEKDTLGKSRFEDFFNIDKKYMIKQEDNFYIKAKFQNKLNLDYLIACLNFNSKQLLNNQLQADLHRTKKFIYQNGKPDNTLKLAETPNNTQAKNNIIMFNKFFFNQPVFQNLDSSQKYKNIVIIDIITTQTLHNFMYSICRNLVITKGLNLNFVPDRPMFHISAHDQYIEYFLKDNSILVVIHYYAKIIYPDNDSLCGGISIKLTLDLTNNTYFCDLYVEYNKKCNYNINKLTNVINENKVKVKVDENKVKVNYFTKNLNRDTCVGCGVGGIALLGTLFFTGVLGGKHSRSKNKIISSKKQKLKIKKTKNQKNKNKKSKKQLF